MASKQKGATKNAKRRAKAKAEKAKQVEATTSTTASTPAPEEASVATAPAISEAEPDVETNDGDNDDSKAPAVQPVSFDIDIDMEDPMYSEFKGILERFQEPEREDAEKKELAKPEVYYDDDDDIPDEDEMTSKPKMSKKARKQLNMLSIAELKALVKKPELVEWTDPTSSDPILLLAIKAHRNVVPVPNHWSLKREYLSSKRGVEKPPFSLPKFIQETGIAEMRDAILEKQEQQTLKQKQRERVQGKLGKLDIDYQKLYEAFFRFQTKPELTRYGEVYYEGKEYETNLRHLRPGELSDELKEALSIPPGAPPPWLINMQRFGPPPSYPALRIPGLNAPPPPGGQWGFHPGGYGKPPVDENNKPLYGGDIFGLLQGQQQNQPSGEPIEKSLWGELQPPEEESEEEEEEDDEDDEDEDEEGNEDEDMRAGLQTPSGLETPSGMASAVPSEFGAADTSEFNLRKQRRGTETEESPHPRSAFQVLPEHNVRSQGFFGSERGYDLKAAMSNQNIPMLGQDENRRKRKAGDVDVSVDVDALTRDDKLSKDEVKKQFDAQRQAEGNPWGTMVDQEDLSQMIADESRKRLKKEEERRNRR